MKGTIRRRLCWFAAVAAAAAAVGSVPAWAELVRGGDLTETVLVRRARYPVRILETRPGACDGLAPGNVELLLDGRRVDVEAVERTRLQTVHAVLVDTSYSMVRRGRLERALEAAREYVRSLPAKEDVLLATFDDNLVLRAPATTNRERLERALEGIHAGLSTSLYDAVYDTIEYLAQDPRRKVIVVLTDGCDGGSLASHPFDAVLDRAGGADDLAVFPIGVDLPSRCPGSTSRVSGAARPDVLLHRLAVWSGGESYQVRFVQELPRVFGDIRRRLEEEGYIIYRPSADMTTGPRRRRLRVRVRGLDGCRIRRAAAASVGGGAERGPIVVEPPASPGGSFSKTPAFPHGVALRLRFTDVPSRARDDGDFFLRLRERSVSGRIVEVEEDQGVLYARRTGRTNGSPRLRIVPWERYGEREFEMGVPEFEAARRDLAGATGWIRYLLEHDLRPFHRDDEGRERLDPAWIHGQTFLDLRPVLGRVLYSYPGYRGWAERRLRRMERARFVRLLDAEEKLGEPERRAILAAFDRREFRPGPRNPQRVLAAWLGDLTARQVAALVDRDGAGRALALSTEPGRRAQPENEEVLGRTWRRLIEWFEPPECVRVITPLVPVYDEENDRFGFYRVVLPSSYARPLWKELPPPGPLGTALVRALAPAAPEGARVESVEYPDVPKQVRRAVPRSTDRGRRARVHAVRVRFLEPDGTTRSVTGYFLVPRRRCGAEATPASAEELRPACIESAPGWPREADLRICSAGERNQNLR